MAMGRVLYPHEKLPDAVYALLAKDLDSKAAADAGAAKLLTDGVAEASGLCRGVDADGALLLETVHGPRRILAGDVSLRRA